jgi:hypothetical protein
MDENLSLLRNGTIDFKSQSSLDTSFEIVTAVHLPYTSTTALSLEDKSYKKEAIEGLAVWSQVESAQ